MKRLLLFFTLVIIASFLFMLYLLYTQVDHVTLDMPKLSGKYVLNAKLTETLTLNSNGHYVQCISLTTGKQLKNEGLWSLDKTDGVAQNISLQAALVNQAAMGGNINEYYKSDWELGIIHVYHGSTLLIVNEDSGLYYERLNSSSWLNSLSKLGWH